MARQVSINNTRTCWALKCDVRQFFASINHRILLNILNKRIVDKQLLWLLEKIVESFHSTSSSVGLPLGNLTSQLLANVYLNDLDQFIKQQLRVKYYLRYADDFVLISRDKYELRRQLYLISDWLGESLKLWLHPNKVSISTLASGLDWLGWVHFPKYRVLRTVTKKRMIKALASEPSGATISSYSGLLGWGNAYKLKQLL